MRIFKLIIKIVSVLIILYWPMVLFTSAMMFPTGESSNNIKTVYSVIGLLFYPAYIFALYWIFRWTLFGISGKVLFFSSIVLIIIAFHLFGYTRLVFNTARGINSSGITLKDNSVYFDGKLLTDADISTFKSINGNLEESLKSSDNTFTSDKNSVYYEGKIIEYADPKTFELLEKEFEWWSRDSRNIFYKDRKIDKASVNNFRLIDNRFLLSNDYIYYLGIQILEADPENFEVLNSNFSKDKQHIYYNEKIILPDADMNSFFIYPDDHNLNGYARDSKFFYDPYQNIQLNQVDPDSIQGMDRGYFKDNFSIFTSVNGVFELLKDADPITFIVTNWDEETQSDANDGTNYYINGELLESK